MKIKIKKDKNTVTIAIVSGLVALLLVSSMLMQFRSVDESNKAGIEGLRNDELKTQIATYKSKYEETMAKYEENMNTINEYEKTTEATEETSKVIDQELEQTNTLLGLTDVVGEGVIITLDNTNEASYTSEDLRTIVNELKYAGAEAISINGNRIINLTDIVTVNNEFIVMYGGNVRITAPYTIKAIGDRTYLTSTLNIKNSGVVDSMKSNGLSIKVEQSSSVAIGKYTRKIETKYIKEEK